MDKFVAATTQINQFKKDKEKTLSFVGTVLFLIISKTASLREIKDPAKVESEIQTLTDLVKDILELAKLVETCVQSVSKFQFPKDVWSGKFKDPFKPVRELARKINDKWGLDCDV